MIKPENYAQYETIFSQPSIEEMLTLSPKAFEGFVAYVFTKAGYTVNDVAYKFLKGVDLELYRNQPSKKRLGGIEVKRNNPENLIPAHTVQKLLGAPSLRGKVDGYLVSTSNYTKPAHDLGATNRNIHLMNGGQLVRYIQYIQGSAYEQSSPLDSQIPATVFSGSHDIKSLKPSKVKVIAIANNKGGVGKTTTAEYLAQTLAEKGKSILLVDLDPQANLSERLLGIAAQAISSPNITQYFSNRMPFSQISRNISSNNTIFLIPSHPSLGKLDLGGFGHPLEECQFVLDFYKYLNGNFDYIILDTPPAISYFTRIALATANYVIIPIRPRPSSLTGTSNIINAIKTMGSLVGTQPHLIGGLTTHWNDDAASRNNIAPYEVYFKASGSRLLTTRIPFDVTIEKTGTRGVGSARAAYHQLAEEVLNDIRNFG